MDVRALKVWEVYIHFFPPTREDPHEKSGSCLY